MILGVDISTSITGFAVVADGQLVYYDSIDLRKYKNIFDKTIGHSDVIQKPGSELYTSDNDGENC